MLVQSGFITETEVARLRKAGAVGNSLGRFIDARGVVVDPALDGRIVGLDLEALCRKTVRLRQRPRHRRADGADRPGGHPRLLIGERGGVIGTVFAVMLLQVLRNIFNLLGLGSFYQMTITGLIIILAILLNRAIDSRQGRR